MNLLTKSLCLAAIACAATAPGASAADINGTNNGEVIIGTSSSDNIDAMGGNDLVWGLGGLKDILKGGDGDDVIYGDGTCMGGSGGGSYCDSGEATTDGVDDIKGGNGNDVIFGQGKNDILAGGDGNDTIDGGSGNDSINGGDGNDVLTGGTGADTISGMGGNDTIRVRDGVKDTVDCGPGFDTVTADFLDTVKNCESVSRA